MPEDLKRSNPPQSPFTKEGSSALPFDKGEMEGILFTQPFSVTQCFCGSIIIYSSPKFLKICRPMSWLFSGWNWVAMMLSRQSEAQNSISP